MADERSPAFQFYPRDFLSSDSVSLMTGEQIGAYVLLLCHAWLRPEGLPAAPSSLAKLARMSTARFERAVWPAIRCCFVQTDRGHWVNVRLEAERQKQAEFREAASRAGKRSAERRANARSTPVQRPFNEPTNGTSTDTPTDGQRKVNSSSSSSSSSADPLPQNGSGGAHAPTAPPLRTDPIFGRRNPDLLTFGPVKLWASQFRDEILPLVATHFGGNRDAAESPARAWIGELDEQNQRTTPSRDAISKPSKWWSERAAERWGVAQSVVDDPWLRGGRSH